jgi:hypothetical protein
MTAQTVACSRLGTGRQQLIAEAPDVSAAPGAPGLSLPVTRSADHAAEPRVGHGCYLYPIAARGFLYLVAVMDWRAVMSCPGACRTRSMRASAWTPCTRRSSAMDLRRSLIATREPIHQRRLHRRAQGGGHLHLDGRPWRSLKYECVYLSEFTTGSQARSRGGLGLLEEPLLGVRRGVYALARTRAAL